MILGGKDFDIDTLLTQLELENFVSRIHAHGQRRGGQEETTAQIPSTVLKNRHYSLSNIASSETLVYEEDLLLLNSKYPVYKVGLDTGNTYSTA
jgi:hypothetical protein